MTAQHTPGPFQVSGLVKTSRADSVRVVRITAPNPTGGGMDVAECLECNGPLIAAAPELLAALHIIHANAGESPEWIRRHASAAIALATGGSQ